MATTFVWKGRSPSGEILSGEYVTENKQELISHLRKRKVIVTSLKQKSKDINIPLPFSKKVSVKDLGVFTRQFATMINAGRQGLLQKIDKGMWTLIKKGTPQKKEKKK